MGKKPKTQIEYQPLASLKKHPKNPRVIRDADFKKLVKSIDENPDYFEARPIIISERTGERIIIAGNQRYSAAREIGIKDVPCIILPGLTEEREQEIMIRDNVSNGNWDFDMLAADWDAELLNDWGVDVPVWGGDDFGDKNKELDLDSFENVMELKLKFSKNDFFSVSQSLDDVADQNGLDSKEAALKFVLGQNDGSEL